MKKLIFILLLLAFIKSDQYFYLRVFDCIKNNGKGCTQWNQSTLLNFNSYLEFFYCLSEHNYVLTRDGPKSVKDLAIGDEIWSYDMETGQQTYSELVAWLHRDTKGIVNYDLIETNQGIQFQASDFHNIGFVDDLGKIDFKFVEDLKQGDELVGFPEHNLFVQQAKIQVERRGLYSPFTSTGNYYIFNTSETGNIQASSNDPMILVHALSQIENPNSQLHRAETFLKIWSILGLNKQPNDDEVYIHPLYDNFNFLFGSAWHSSEPRRVKYEVDRHFQVLPSSHLKPLESHESSVSSSNNDAQRRLRQMKALGISCNILQEVPFL